MDKKICSMKITYHDIWRFVEKWDYHFSQKIARDGKQLELCKKLSEIPTLMNNIINYYATRLKYKSTQKTISQIKNTLTHIIYKIPRPIYENEAGTKWNSNKYWKYNEQYDEKRQKVLNEPFDINSVKYNKINLIFNECELDTIWEDY